MSKLIILEGRNTVHDALESDKTIKLVMVAEESSQDPKIQTIIQMAKNKHIPVSYGSAKKLRQMAKTNNTQNVLAEMELEDMSLKSILEAKPNPFILIFNRLDYEQNLGAILRTAWGAGVDAVVVSTNGVHELTPVVTKVSMGGAANVPLFGESVFNVLKMLQQMAIPIVGVEAGMGESYTNQNLIGAVALVFGGEDSGLSDPIKKYCDLFIHIPLASHLSSLNVSVATAVVCFEKLRQEQS